MSNNISLSRFIRNDDTQLRLFDMGRRVSKIRVSDFEKFELGEVAYPFPYQQTAWVGILFWNVKNKEQHNLWFIRMPLDERGYINVASRDEFMDMLLSRIAEQITSKHAVDTDIEKENDLTHALKDNPYVFKPTEENMAVFHAKAKQILGLSPSAFLSDTINYLSLLDGENKDKWQHLGVQGFADIAVRQDNIEINKIITNAISGLPQEPYCALCNALENENCTPEIMNEIVLVLRDLINKKRKQDESLDDTHIITKIVSSMRAIASVSSNQFLSKTITEVLESQYGKEPAVLVMIAAKLWEVLDEQGVLKCYLEMLAQNPKGQTLFNALISDQMFMPGKRQKILSIFRDQDRSETLSSAVGGFFQHMGNVK